MFPKFPYFVTFTGVFLRQKILFKLTKKCGMKNVQLNDREIPEFCKTV
jgi:hypothetical protein